MFLGGIGLRRVAVRKGLAFLDGFIECIFKDLGELNKMLMKEVVKEGFVGKDADAFLGICVKVGLDLGQELLTMHNWLER